MEERRSSFEVFSFHFALDEQGRRSRLSFLEVSNEDGELAGLVEAVKDLAQGGPQAIYSY